MPLDVKDAGWQLWVCCQYSLASSLTFATIDPLSPPLALWSPAPPRPKSDSDLHVPLHATCMPCPSAHLHAIAVAPTPDGGVSSQPMDQRLMRRVNRFTSAA
eukprot:scaffold239603_cov30-Tisochrysis_lutea.AAC.7